MQIAKQSKEPKELKEPKEAKDGIKPPRPSLHNKKNLTQVGKLSGSVKKINSSEREGDMRIQQERQQISSQQSKKRKNLTLKLQTRTLKNLQDENEKKNVSLNTKGMIRLVLDKGKNFKQLFVKLGLTQTWLQKNLLNQQHFNASIHSFLIRLIKKGELSAQLKNINKQVFEQIEEFVCERADKLFKMQRLIQTSQEREKGIQKMLQARISQLKKKII